MFTTGDVRVISHIVWDYQKFIRSVLLESTLPFFAYLTFILAQQGIFVSFLRPATGSQ